MRRYRQSGDQSLHAAVFLSFSFPTPPQKSHGRSQTWCGSSRPTRRHPLTRSACPVRTRRQWQLGKSAGHRACCRAPYIFFHHYFRGLFFFFFWHSLCPLAFQSCNPPSPLRRRRRRTHPPVLCNTLPRTCSRCVPFLFLGLKMADFQHTHLAIHGRLSHYNV